MVCQKLSFWVKNISATDVRLGVLSLTPFTWILDPTTTSYTTEINSNGWTRISRTFTVGSTIVSVYPFHSVNVGGELLIWGVQLETGSFPTSYIPTSGSTVTRAADIASITGTNFSGFYNQSEGTAFVDATPDEVVNATNICSFSDGTFSNRHQFYAETNFYFLRTGASGSASGNTLGAAVANTKAKVAFSFANLTHKYHRHSILLSRRKPRGSEIKMNE